MDELKEMKKVFDDAKQIQQILAKYNINTQQYLNSIPVMLNLFFTDKKELMDTSRNILKEIAILHGLLHKKK